MQTRSFSHFFLNDQYCLWLTDVHAISKDLCVHLCEFVGTCIQVPDARSPAARVRPQVKQCECWEPCTGAVKSS